VGIVIISADFEGGVKLTLSQGFTGDLIIFGIDEILGQLVHEFSHGV
jgi:hypothetical protein